MLMMKFIVIMQSSRKSTQDQNWCSLEQNVILLSASCTISGSPIKRDKVKKQLIKSCMKFQYMEIPRKRKKSETVEFSSYKKQPFLQIGLGEIPAANEEDEEEDDSEDDDSEDDDSEDDDSEDDDSEDDDLEKEEYGQD